MIHKILYDVHRVNRYSNIHKSFDNFPSLSIFGTPKPKIQVSAEGYGLWSVDCIADVIRRVQISIGSPTFGQITQVLKSGVSMFLTLTDERVSKSSHKLHWIRKKSLNILVSCHFVPVITPIR